MKKLFNLKKWLTLDEAARHLTIVFGEDICVADVLRLALDRHLTLSVNFINPTHATKCIVRSVADAKYVEIPPEDAKFIADLMPEAFVPVNTEDLYPSIKIFNGFQFDEEHVLNFDREIVVLEGIYDIPQIGSERLNIEHEFQILTNGSGIRHSKLMGTFVGSVADGIYQLMTSVDEDETKQGSTGHLRMLRARVASGVADSMALQDLLAAHDLKREEFLAGVRENRRVLMNFKNYFVANQLPEDSFFVVRTDVIRKFEQSISDKPNSIDKPLTTTERTSLLLIIAAFCKNKSIDPVGRDAVAKIQGFLISLDVKMDDDTVRKVLKRIPDAIERRMRNS